MFNVELHNGKVPCGSCNYCCYHPHIDLTPGDDLTGLDTEIRDDGKRYLRRRADGGCIHLTEAGACGIYEHRPTGCRTYDCRLYTAFGIGVRYLGGKLAPKWTFLLVDDADRELVGVVEAAQKTMPAGLDAEDCLEYMMLAVLRPDLLAEIKRHPEANLMQSIKATMKNFDKLMQNDEKSS